MYYQFKCKRHGIYEVRQGILEEHQAFCPVCDCCMQRVYQPVTHFLPDSLWNKDGSRQSPDKLPPVPHDQNYGWHGFGEGKRGEE